MMMVNVVPRVTVWAFGFVRVVIAVVADVLLVVAVLAPACVGEVSGGGSVVMVARVEVARGSRWLSAPGGGLIGSSDIWGSVDGWCDGRHQASGSPSPSAPQFERFSSSSLSTHRL